jgi:hypothetical protein
MKNVLIDRALKYPHPNKPNGRSDIPVTKQECELFIEMLEGRVTVRQYAYAIGFSGKPGSISHRTMTVIRKGIQNGWLTLKLQN